MPPKTNKAGKKRATWTPPPGLDVDDVLREALRDGKEGRYEEALGKHLWFHKHALERRRSLSGVRRSYALNGWVELGRKYPPALKTLLKVRGISERHVKLGREVWNNFHDVESINDYLNDKTRTVALFKWLNAHDPEGALKVYNSVEELLFSVGEWELCNEFLKPERFDSIRRLYRINLRLAKDPKVGDDYDVFAVNRFTTCSLRLIRLLVLNGRHLEAKSVARKAVRVLKEASFKADIAEALKVKT